MLNRSEVFYRSFIKFKLFYVKKIEMSFVNIKKCLQMHCYYIIVDDDFELIYNFFVFTSVVESPRLILQNLTR